MAPTVYGAQDERLRELEARVSALEKALSQLNNTGIGFTNEGEAADVKSPQWSKRQAWDNVAIGLAMHEIEALLGEPTRKQDAAYSLGNDSTWFYEGIFDSTDLVGNVRFVNKKVASFKRPDSLRANSRVYELKEGLDYVVNVTVGAVGIVNYSNHVINEVKFEWASTSCAETTFERSWGEEPNVLAGREIPPGRQYSWPPPPSYGCVLSRVRSLKR